MINTVHHFSRGVVDGLRASQVFAPERPWVMLYTTSRQYQQASDLSLNKNNKNCECLCPMSLFIERSLCMLRLMFSIVRHKSVSRRFETLNDCSFKTPFRHPTTSSRVQTPRQGVFYAIQGTRRKCNI